MKKGIFKTFAVITLSICFGLLGAACNSASSNSSQSDATKEDVLEKFVDSVIPYNEVYSFPISINGQVLNYSVKDSKGEKVAVFNNSFAVNTLSAYSVTVSCGKFSKTYKLTPQDLTAPVIRVARNVQRKNVLNNEKVYFPETTITDNVDAEVKASYKVLFNGETYESEADGFTPMELGFYDLIISATDMAGNIADYKIVYESVGTIEETYKVFAFDEDPLRYIDFVGLDSRGGLTYNTDKAFIYGEEKGSTRISGEAMGTPLLLLKNQMMDTSEFDYVRFYIYNAGKVAITLGTNIINRMYVLQPNEWTEVVIASWESAFVPGMNHSDINGLPIQLDNTIVTNRFGYAIDLYFSAAYGVINQGA